MPIKPPDDERSKAAQPGTQAQTAKSHPPLERSRFGGTERRPERAVDDDTPVSRSDLSKGPRNCSSTAPSVSTGAFC